MSVCKRGVVGALVDVLELSDLGVCICILFLYSSRETCNH